MVAIGQMYSSPDWKKVLWAIEVGTQRLHSTDLSDFEGQEGPYIDLPGRFGELHLSISSACGMIKDHGRAWKTKFPPGETMEEPCVNRVPAMDLWSLGVSYGTWAVRQVMFSVPPRWASRAVVPSSWWPWTAAMWRWSMPQPAGWSAEFLDLPSDFLMCNGSLHSRYGNQTYSNMAMETYPLIVDVPI